MFRSLTLLVITLCATASLAQDAPARAPVQGDVVLDSPAAAPAPAGEELLFPANTQVAVFVSMDVGEFFALDSVTLKLDNKEVANYLYTEREAQALLKGGVHRVYIGNLKAGDHELLALFTGQGPHVRDYRRGATIKLTKGVGAKYVELKISDRAQKEQPEFIVKEWE